MALPLSAYIIQCSDVIVVRASRPSRRDFIRCPGSACAANQLTLLPERLSRRQQCTLEETIYTLIDTLGLFLYRDSVRIRVNHAAKN